MSSWQGQPGSQHFPIYYSPIHFIFAMIEEHWMDEVSLVLQMRVSIFHWKGLFQSWIAKDLTGETYQ